MAEPAFQEMSRRHLAGGYVIGKDAGEFRFGAAFKQLDDRLAGIAINAGQAIVIDLADDSIGIPILEPGGQILAGVTLNSAIDAKEPGETEPAFGVRQSGGIHVSLARGGDDPAQYASGVCKFGRQDQSDVDEFDGAVPWQRG
jgi:hypothetical protein